MGRPSLSRRGPNELSERLGERVRALRKRKDWSLEELAGRAGVHVTYLSSVERGYRNPTLNVLAALASALEITLSLLLKGVEKGE
ncbi:MAG: DNA-binding protein [Limisphaerales bacterium]|mgnify:FL=1|nr:MAG: DNA-binding protein [Limisphaerales bacterium]KAG0509411.1 MAG: DNA-binding protein [Limisphaerales bacterium]TXT52156.1 MAG: DNA-binding protein [Limisphaerales bacterium]